MNQSLKTPGIDINQTNGIKCEKCESDVFIEAFFLRRASKLLTGSSHDTIIPIPTFQCSICKHINKDFTPNIEQHDS
jgi:hypothetical protein